jgi:hypothetical protein
MLVKMKFVVFVILILMIILKFDGVLFCGKTTLTSNEIDSQVAFILSKDKKKILYQTKYSKQWLVFLTISQINSGIISHLLPWHRANLFTQVIPTPDKNKIIISVCDNLIPEDDNAEHWLVSYDLKRGESIEIPGNHVEGFSSNHQLIFTSFINEEMPGVTKHYVVGLSNGKVFLSH